MSTAKAGNGDMKWVEVDAEQLKEEVRQRNLFRSLLEETQQMLTCIQTNKNFSSCKYKSLLELSKAIEQLLTQ